MRITISAFLLLLIATIHSLRVTHFAEPGRDIIVGGYGSLSVDNLSDDAKEVDKFIRGQHTDIKDGKLISASRQVVAGYNYHYIYESVDGKKQWDIIVYKNLKGNLYENGFTYTQALPNGQKVQAIGDPASAFGGNYDSQQPPVRVSASFNPTSQNSPIELKMLSKPPTSQASSTVVANRDTLPNTVEPVPIK